MWSPLKAILAGRFPALVPHASGMAWAAREGPWVRDGVWGQPGFQGTILQLCRGQSSAFVSSSSINCFQIVSHFFVFFLQSIFFLRFASFSINSFSLYRIMLCVRTVVIELPDIFVLSFFLSNNYKSCRAFSLL